MENNQSQSFHYTYSAKQQEEIKKIREKYISRETTTNETDKMKQLRKLDKSVSQKSTSASLTVGTLGTLIFGVGMCCCMVWEQFLLGIPVGIAGIILVAFAYPVYNCVTRKEREKIAAEVIRLTDELMQ